MQESVIGSRYFAWTDYCILHYKVILTTSSLRLWYISTTLLLYNLSFVVLGRKLKVAPDTDLGIKK